MSNWPDTTRPGVPLNPEQDGWHRLQEGDRNPECAFWRAKPYLGNKRGCWSAIETTDDFEPHEISTWRYLGPVLTPDEAAALQARIAELETALLTAEQELSANALQRAFIEIRAALEGGEDE